MVFLQCAPSNWKKKKKNKNKIVSSEFYTILKLKSYFPSGYILSIKVVLLIETFAAHSTTVRSFSSMSSLKDNEDLESRFYGIIQKVFLQKDS